MTGARSAWERKTVLGALIGIGIALRLTQYFANASLRVDEAMVAMSVVRRSAVALVLSPLDYCQVAPPLFLLAQKAAIGFLGPNEFALRLPALLCSIAALVAFTAVARRALRGAAVPFAVLLMSIAPILVEYSAAAKQYSGDVLAAVLLALIALELRSSHFSRGRVISTAVFGVIVVWLSQASVIVLTGTGLALGTLALLERDTRARTASIVLAIAWSVSAAVAVLAARHNMGAETSSRMEHYWVDHFMPFPPTTWSGALWLWRAHREIYMSGMGYWRVGDACIVISMLGAWALWRKGRRDVVLLLLLPVLVTLIASAARQYPFYGRLILFLLPAYIITFAAGMAWIMALLSKKMPVTSVAIPLLLAVPPLYVIGRYHPPWWDEEIKPVLRHVAANRRVGDAVYVFYGAEPAMSFYAPGYGFSRSDWLAGGKHRSDLRSYLTELDHFRGRRRVWVLFAHDLIAGEREAITGYLDRIGLPDRHARYPAARIPRPDAVVFLYDLGDSARLASSSAISYPLP